MSSTATRLASEARAAHERYVDAARTGTGAAGARIEYLTLSAAADAAALTEQSASRSAGVCSVCGDTGYQPWQLDDSARCLRCQP